MRSCIHTGWQTTGCTVALRTHTHAACGHEAIIAPKHLFSPLSSPNLVLTDCAGRDGEQKRQWYWSRAKEKETQSSLIGEGRKKGENRLMRETITAALSTTHGSRLFSSWFSPQGATVQFFLNVTIYKDKIVHTKLYYHFILFVQDELHEIFRPFYAIKSHLYTFTTVSTL